MASFATAIEEDQYAVCARNGMETERLILQVSYTYVSGLHKYSFPGFPGKRTNPIPSTQGFALVASQPRTDSKTNPAWFPGFISF